MEGSKVKHPGVAQRNRQRLQLRKYKLQFVFLYKIRSFLISLPILICVLWTAFPALRSLAGITSLKLKGTDAFAQEESALDLKRAIQKHFLYYGVYIPLEDIALEDEVVSNGTLSSVRRYCGKAALYVWIPYRFRLPVLGETLTEVCQTVL